MQRVKLTEDQIDRVVRKRLLQFEHLSHVEGNRWSRNILDWKPTTAVGCEDDPEEFEVRRKVGYVKYTYNEEDTQERTWRTHKYIYTYLQTYIHTYIHTYI